MTTAIVIFTIAALGGLIFGLLRAEWREQRAVWTPFGRDGRLRSDLFTPTSEGGQGFTQIGALRDDEGIK